MSRLIGVVLMVFALMFGMTLTGCKKGPEKKKSEEVKKAVEGATEEGAKKAEEIKKDVQKKAEEASPKK
ncbi:MAG: hypothetical protein GWP05_04875 [Anaerolineaceae bacterium]|nr:hypothetical protein [Anaerolineaceae bacterium]